MLSVWPSVGMLTWFGALRGAEEAFIADMVVDLARLHGGLANSPILDDACMAVLGQPEWFQKAGCSFTPACIGIMAKHFDVVSAEDQAVSGCEPGIPNNEAFAQLLAAKKDELKFSYVGSDGKTYWCGDPAGTVPLPFPQLAGEQGKKLLIAICKKLGGRKVQTMIHGDAHPGNVFFQAESKQFTWIDFQCLHKGPPGWELSQGLPLALQDADLPMFKRVVKTYYDAFVAAAPDGTATLYTEEECWEDFMLGCLLWSFAYTKINMQSLPPLLSLPEDSPILGAWRVIYPRAYASYETIG